MPPPPYQELIFPPSPAAGADFVWTVRGNSRMALVTLMCQVAAAVGGSDRGVSLQFANQAGLRFGVAGTPVLLAAGTTQAFGWQAASTSPVHPVDDTALGGLPYIQLIPGCTATIHITNVQAGDQISAVGFAADFFPPQSDEPGEVPYPLLDAQAFEAITELRDHMGALTLALTGSTVESRRARLQREALAVRS